MSEHPSHKLDAYKDGAHTWVTFCSVCSREGEQLNDPCPKKFSLINQKKDIDSVKERT